jgi:hypothetical protein
MPTATHLTRDDNDEDVDVATAIERGLSMAMALGNNRIIGGPAPAGKTLSASKKAPGKAAKLCLGAASDKTRAVARAGTPTTMHLTRDNDDEDVDVTTAIKRGLTMRMVLGNHRIIGGPAPAGKTSSASKKAPGKAAKLRIGAVSNGMRAVARAGMPTGAHLTMDDDDKDVNVATASERGLAMKTALGNDRIIGGRVGANDRPETREVAVAGMPTGVHRAGKPSRHQPLNHRVLSSRRAVEPTSRQAIEPSSHPTVEPPSWRAVKSSTGEPSSQRAVEPSIRQAVDPPNR